MGGSENVPEGEGEPPPQGRQTSGGFGEEFPVGTDRRVVHVPRVPPRSVPAWARMAQERPERWARQGLLVVEASMSVRTSKL